MVLPVDIKKANQTKVDGKIETGAQKKRSFKRVDNARHGVNNPMNAAPESSKQKIQKATNKDGSRTKTCNAKPSNAMSKNGETWECSTSSRSVDQQRPILQPKCYFDLPRPKRQVCNRMTNWQHCEYVRDECGSGIVPKRYNLKASQVQWCKTPLSMYQATIGELGRKLLCAETVITRNINPAPPCNISEYILPPCRGYYKRYDCVKPCEEDHVRTRNNVKIYRDRVDRYWNPCYSKAEQIRIDVNDFAPHNSVLAERYRRNNTDGDLNMPCW